jgi:hypothetical protein
VRVLDHRGSQLAGDEAIGVAAVQVPGLELGSGVGMHRRADHGLDPGAGDLEGLSCHAAEAAAQQVAGEDLGKGRAADVSRAHEEQAEFVLRVVAPMPTHSSIVHDRSTQIVTNLRYRLETSLTQCLALPKGFSSG